MKKILASFVILFLLCVNNITLAQNSLFDKLFDPAYTVETTTATVKAQEGVTDSMINLVDNNFARIKSNLSKYSVDKRIEVYNSAVKKLNKLIISAKTQKDKKVLTYLRDLINKELDTLNNERGLLVELFGDKSNKICNEGYILNNGDCVKKEDTSNNSGVPKRICNVTNGYGNQFYYTNYWSKCYVTACNDGYYLDYNNNCVKNYNNNSNYYYNGNYYNNGYYNNGYYYNCSSNEHYEDGRCVSNSKYCSLDNGYGKQYWNGNYWGNCYAESCNNGFYISSGLCVKTYYNCSNNEHYEDGKCVSNYRYCSLDNGYGKQYWNGTYWNSCYAESCNSGYYLSNGTCLRNYNYNNCGSNEHYEDGRCISNNRYCSISNGYGRQYWNGNYWNSCYAESCNSGYYLSNGNCYRN